MIDDSYHTVVGQRLFGYDICCHLLKLSKLMKLVSQDHIQLYIQEARPKTLGRSQFVKAGSGTMEAKMPDSCFR